MTFENRLKATLQRADARAPGAGLAWEPTIARARRERFVRLAFAGTVAAVALAAGTVSATGLLQGRSQPPAAPAPTDSELTETPREPTPTPTQAPTEPPPTMSPSPEPRSTSPEACASPVGETGSQGDLPREVAKMRDAILVAAERCDAEKLASLALEGNRFFINSSGTEETPSRAELVRFFDSRDTLTHLVTVLNWPACKESVDATTFYKWPSAFCDDATEEDWSYVRSLYSEKEIQDMKKFGSYIGVRLTITGSGDWENFVLGGD